MRPDIIFVARDWCDINGVKYICAPFEADWQLAMMCKQGFIQGVISEDSDMIVLGVPKVIMGLNLADKSFILVEHDHILEQLKQFFRVDKFTHDHLLACAAFLGCDYLDNVKGNGLVEVGKVMRIWCGLLSVSEENMILTNYESTKVWNASNGGGICENYTRQFRSCTNMWKYAVGWKIVPNNNNLVPTSIDELLSPGSYSVEMDSLNERQHDEDWEELIGFTPLEVFQSTNDLDVFTFMDYCTLKYYPRTGQLVQPVAPMLVPFGAYFDPSTPLNCQPMSALVQWLCARRIPVRQHDTRAELLALVQKILDFQVRVNNSDIPAVIPLPVGGVGKYLSWETLTTNAVVEWKSGDDLFNTLQEDFPLINDNLINATFGEGQPALRLKSKRYVRSGHFNYDTMRQGNAIINYGDDGHENVNVRILKIECCASLRSDIYQVLLVFNAVTKEFLPFPISRCQCKNGRVFCSHMLGMLFAISIMQRLRFERPHFRFLDFVARMPAVISSMRCLIVPLSYAIATYASK